ncbi:hypothetical protein BDV26DRAFT_282352 [Aspergillus bertholletiae]|uniref:Uncharacterized protein n=1 Tax=Aspergillus bertholletiae TaxID=1226010 RepID=A0A5N7B423_9EURO|nr:hypothetical protein BDV26DRAFT_282352 [Aspergillus bertholletiae]
MSLSTSYTCSFCGQVSHNTSALTAFVDDSRCSQCGLSASEGNPQMQEDLVALFSRQMRMDIPISFGSQEMPQSTHRPVAYSVTQHYHHSSHVARCTLPAGLPEQDESSGPNVTLNSVHEMLRLQNINPSSLTLTQLQLFENALPEQRSRLIQIWKIFPESSDASSDPKMEGVKQSNSGLGAYSSGRAAINAGGSNQSIHYTGDMDISDSMHDGNNDDDGHQYAEPYMISGYEVLAQRDYDLSAGKLAPVMNEPTTGSPYRLANDPIYGTQGHRWWERSQPSTLECQYSTLEEINRHAGCGLLQPTWLA